MSIWFSIYDREDYKGPEPSFYETREIEFSKMFEDNYTIIKGELGEYLNKNKLKSYFNSSMVEEFGSWKTVSLRSWSINIYENYKFFPKTLELINSIDGLVSASFNKLEAGGKIKPHCGDTNGIYRCHLGLEIPAQLPDCGFRVKDEWRNWEEGKLLVFVDANNHEAINLSNSDRFIFLFDVVRPEYRARKNYICATVMTSLFMQKRAEGFAFLYKTPMWIQRIAGFILLPCAAAAIKVRNFTYQFIQK